VKLLIITPTSDDIIVSITEYLQQLFFVRRINAGSDSVSSG